ncbi:MAG: ATP-binding protein [Deltaproteobacteria bacterium]|nr:ATP-binding protein [Deltaproteobacteria bacterium]
MWIERPNKKANFINALLGVKDQVLIVRGARQVGKTSFILNALNQLNDHPQLKLNLLYPSSFKIEGIDYLGRDFLGKSETGEDLLKNIETELGGGKGLQRPALIFVDEADRYPQALEFIQTLAQFSDKLKFVFTGSNLENVRLKNAATGRKKHFDLYPITFREFLNASGDEKLCKYLEEISLTKGSFSDFYHKRLSELQNIYIRVGGMPKVVAAYLEPAKRGELPEIIKDLAFSIEENVKTVLGEKSKLYEYEDVLRKIAFLSMNTLKFSHLQVQHAGRSEAKQLVAKSVGARVVHKIRLFDSENDLSKYMIFDCGIANYLINGSDVLKTALDERSAGILYETFAGAELIAGLLTRDDLLYWKSENKAEVEFFLRSPCAGIDVKTKGGNIRSLNSLALVEPSISYLIKVYDGQPQLDRNHIAKLPTSDNERKIPLISIPHYLVCRISELIEEK